MLNFTLNVLFMKTFKLPIVIAISFAVGVLFTILVNRFNPSVSKNQICLSYTEDDIHRITLDELMEDAARYRDTHAKPTEAAMRSLSLQNDTASRSCYFNVDVLKKFLYYVEMYSREHKIESKDLAINFYYTIYPKEKIMPDGKQYGSLHSLYLVPAKSVSKGAGYDDFDPITNKTLAQLVSNDKASQSSGQSNIIERIKGTKIFAIAPQPFTQLKSRSLSSLSNTSPLIRNQGGLCPCPPKDLFAEIDALYPTVGY
jgi:hypothetical protein